VENTVAVEDRRRSTFLMSFNKDRVVELPDFLHDKASNAPESGYGVVTATVILKDGRRFPNIKIAWGHQIVKYEGKTNIPFSTEDIVDIEIER